MELVSTIEIARMLGVSRQRVDQLRKSGEFPEPVDVLAVGRIWRRADVAAWAVAHGRSLKSCEARSAATS